MVRLLNEIRNRGSQKVLLSNQSIEMHSKYVVFLFAEGVRQALRWQGGSGEEGDLGEEGGRHRPPQPPGGHEDAPLQDGHQRVLGHGEYSIMLLFSHYKTSYGIM